MRSLSVQVGIEIPPPPPHPPPPGLEAAFVVTLKIQVKSPTTSAALTVVLYAEEEVSCTSILSPL